MGPLDVRQTNEMQAPTGQLQPPLNGKIKFFDFLSSCCFQQPQQQQQV